MSADSISNKAAKKVNQVVASVPPKLGVSTYDWVGGASANPANRPRTADRAARVGSLVTTAAAGQPAYNYEGGTTAQNTAYDKANMYNQSGPKAGTVDALAPYGGLAGLVKAIQGGGSGSTAGKDTALDWAKFNAEQAANATTTATALRALQGLQGRLASGGYRGNADTLLDLIRGRSTAGQAAITGNYDTDVSNINNTFTTDTDYVKGVYDRGVGNINDAYNTETGYANDIYNRGVTNATNTYNTGVGNINAGFDTGQGMINSGYGELDKFLNANQINPYANLQQQSGPVNNAMANYLSAYGVSNDPVNQQVQASQMANQQGADSFNQLQQLMSANQLANNQSNIDVSQMAKNYATTGLGAQRSRYLGNAESARTEALNSFLSSLNDAMYSAGTSRTAAMNAADDAQAEGLYGANTARTTGLNTAGSQRTGALNTLADTIAGEQFNVEKDVGIAKTELENAIIAAGGSTSGIAANVNPATGRLDTGPAAAGAGANGQPVVAGSATSRADQVAAAPDNYPNFKAALAGLNPNYKFTTMAAAKKKFPALANAF